MGSLQGLEIRCQLLAGRYDNPIPTRFLAPIDRSHDRCLFLGDELSEDLFQLRFAKEKYFQRHFAH
jgi:hypothetical protein